MAIPLGTRLPIVSLAGGVRTVRTTAGVGLFPALRAVGARRLIGGIAPRCWRWARRHIHIANQSIVWRPSSWLLRRDGGAPCHIRHFCCLCCYTPGPYYYRPMSGLRMLSTRSVWDSCLESDGTTESEMMKYYNRLVWLHCPVSYPVDTSRYLGTWLDMSLSSRSRRGPSRRCTTMSKVGSRPPELSNHVRSGGRLSDTLMCSWRATFAGVTSSSRATSTCPNTEMRRRYRRWDSEVRPVRCSTSSFRVLERAQKSRNETGWEQDDCPRVVSSTDSLPGDGAWCVWLVGVRRTYGS